MTDSGAEKAALAELKKQDARFDPLFAPDEVRLPILQQFRAAIISEETGTQYAQGQLDEFLKIKDERPLDPAYWDLDEEERLRAALPPAPEEGGKR